MKKVIYVLCAIYTLFSCNSNRNPTENLQVSDTIPEGAITFDYKYHLINLKAIYEDSIPMNFIFDTGWVGLSISDSLKPENDKTGRKRFTKKVKVNNIEHTWDNMYYLGNHGMYIGFNKMHGIFDWKIFEGKIIKISYRYKYISILDNTDSLNDYDSIKIIRKYDIRLGIPVTVNVQGKRIKEYVLLDTGFNGRIDFNDNITEKYEIKNETGKEGERGFPAKVDSIGLGKYYLVEDNQTIVFMKKGGFDKLISKGFHYGFDGLLGNRVLENFDIVLDLKNYYLYLKPLIHL